MRIQVTSTQTQYSVLVCICVSILAYSANAAAQSVKSHPWLAEAPGEFVRLIDRGNVSIVVDDERIRKAGKSALTLFQFVIDYDFKYRHQLLGFDNENQAWQARIVAWMDLPKIKLEHKICIQSSFTPAMPWESKLLRHEFDHVAISTDPRFLKIIKRSLQQRRQWIEKWEQASEPTEKDVRERIQTAIKSQAQLLEKLVQSQYDLLDAESSQGLSIIGGRKEFFCGLYTVEGLERCKFEMDKATQSFVNSLESASRREVDAHYLFLKP